MVLTKSHVCYTGLAEAAKEVRPTAVKVITKEQGCPMDTSAGPLPSIHFLQDCVQNFRFGLLPDTFWELKLIVQDHRSNEQREIRVACDLVPEEVDFDTQDLGHQASAVPANPADPKPDADISLLSAMSEDQGASSSPAPSNVLPPPAEAPIGLPGAPQHQVAMDEDLVHTSAAEGIIPPAPARELQAPPEPQEPQACRVPPGVSTPPTPQSLPALERSPAPIQPLPTPPEASPARFPPSAANSQDTTNLSPPVSDGHGGNGDLGTDGEESDSEWSCFSGGSSLSSVPFDISSHRLGNIVVLIGFLFGVWKLKVKLAKVDG